MENTTVKKSVRKFPFRFNIGNDIDLLKTSRTLRPWDSATGWRDVALKLQKEHKYSLTGRTCRDRFRHLINAFKRSKTMAPLKKSGTEEECRERQHLLQKLADVLDDNYITSSNLQQDSEEIANDPTCASHSAGSSMLDTDTRSPQNGEDVAVLQPVPDGIDETTDIYHVCPAEGSHVCPAEGTASSSFHEPKQTDKHKRSEDSIIADKKETYNTCEIMQWKLQLKRERLQMEKLKENAEIERARKDQELEERRLALEERKLQIEEEKIRSQSQIEMMKNALEERRLDQQSAIMEVFSKVIDILGSSRK